MKKHPKLKAVVLIDAENISETFADKIIGICESHYTVAEYRIYHRAKDQGTRRWTERSKGGDFLDIQLSSPPVKNKVDRRIKKHARNLMNRPDVDGICVVSSDGGFCSLTEDAAAAGKQLCFIGGKTPSHRLRRSGAQFMRLR